MCLSMLASFTQHNVFKLLSPCSMYQYFIPFYGSITSIFSIKTFEGVLKTWYLPTYRPTISVPLWAVTSSHSKSEILVHNKVQVLREHVQLKL